jgi:hypothetical protein
MPMTLSKNSYDTRSIVHFEALEQTLRLRLVPGPVDKHFYRLVWRLLRTFSLKTHTYTLGYSKYTPYESCGHES